MNDTTISSHFTLAFLVLAVRGSLCPAVVVGLTRGDCSTRRSLEGAEAARGDAAARLEHNTHKDSHQAQHNSISYFMTLFLGVVGFVPYVISRRVRASFSFCWKAMIDRMLI